MVRVPLPQEPTRPAGGNGVSAPGVAAPLPNIPAQQTQQLGQTLQSVGLSIAGEAAALRESLHISAVKEAQALAEEKIAARDLDYLSKIGKDAATDFAWDRAWQGLRQEVMTIESGLEHEQERALFRQVMSRRMPTIQRRWGAHRVQQARNLEIGASEAVLEAKIEAARRQHPVATPTEGAQEPRAGAGLSVPAGTAPEGAAAGEAPGDLLRAVRAEARALATKLRRSPEEVDAFARDKVAEVHAGRIEDFAAAGMGTRAREYLEGLPEGALPPDLRARAQKLVRSATLQDESLRLSLQVIENADQEAALIASPPGEDVRDILDGRQYERDLMSSVRLEAFARTRLERMFQSGEIDAEMVDRTLNRIQHEAQFRRQQAAEETNQLLDEAEAWAVENRGLGLEEMPAPLYENLRESGQLPEFLSFMRSGRHTNDMGVLNWFTQLSTEELRSIPPTQMRAKLRTKMDTTTLNWAMGVIEDAHEPGKDIEASVEKRLIQQQFIELGREGSGLELRRGGDTPAGLRGFFQENLTDTLTPEQAERQNRFWIRYNQLKNSVRATGQDITDEQVIQITDQILLENTANVQRNFGFDFLASDVRDVPVAAMTEEELQNAFVSINDEDIPLSEVPGTLSLPGGLPDVTGKGEVAAAIRETLMAKKRSQIAELTGQSPESVRLGPLQHPTPEETIRMWEQTGRPKTAREFFAAEEAFSGASGDEQEKRRAARQALEQLRPPAGSAVQEFFGNKAASIMMQLQQTFGSAEAPASPEQVEEDLQSIRDHVERIINAGPTPDAKNVGGSMSATLRQFMENRGRNNR